MNLQKTIDRNFEEIEFYVDKQNVSQFCMLEERRMLRDSHISTIHGSLIEGKNPLGTLIVNKIEDKFYLIDGNHRIEAVKRFLSRESKSSEVKIKCTLRIYHNLNHAEMLEVYDNETMRINQTYEDKLQLHIDEITFYKLLRDNFPCNVSIYPVKNSLRLRTILNAMFASNNSSVGSYLPFKLNRKNLVDFAKSLLYDDYVFFKDFVNFFIEVYGEISQDNIFSRSQYFMPLYDIYKKNLEIISSDHDQAIARFQRILGKSDLLIYNKIASRESAIILRKRMLEYMNYKITKKAFK